MRTKGRAEVNAAKNKFIEFIFIYVQPLDSLNNCYTSFYGFAKNTFYLLKIYFFGNFQPSISNDYLSRYKRLLLSYKQGNVFTSSASESSTLKQMNLFLFADMLKKLFFNKILFFVTFELGKVVSNE